MATLIRRVGYVNLTVRDQPGEAYRLLSGLASQGVGLLAFSAVPIGPTETQLRLFPDDLDDLIQAAGKIGLVLSKPVTALLIQGDDQMGAVAEIHGRLSEAGVNVYASNGVADGRGRYGYVIYLRPEELGAAENALGI